MNEAEEILVIFLSVALAIFLVLGIVALSITIKVLKSLKRLTYKAEAVSDVIEGSVRSITGIKVISNIFDLIGKIITTDGSAKYGKKH